MGRTGILYADVTQAAAKLLAQGKNPTVDAVREELGSTGSKSTIAPLLKRWKAEHQENAASLETGLPATLMDAMKIVYENLQAEVEQRIEQAQQAHRKELDAMAETLQRQHEENTAAAETNAQLIEDAARAQQVFDQLRAELRALNLTLASAQAENTGLQNRLTDRAAELAAMNQQLAYARAQFEHYQEASSVQRTEERQVFEQRLMRTDQELAGSRQQCTAQQSVLAQQAAQLEQLPGLRQEIQQLQENGRIERRQFELINSERHQLLYQVQQLSSDRSELKQSLEATQQALHDTRLRAAVEEKEIALLAQRLTEAEEKSDRLNDEKSGLLQEQAALQAQLLAQEK